jgi:acetylornithine deacetylase/succinyl-diaminopimelate desuccinylase-like protein
MAPSPPSFTFPPSSLATTSPTTLTQLLTRIASTNPTLSAAEGTGEAQIAAFLYQWFAEHGVEGHWLEDVTGRPSVVGVVRGIGGGRSLMVNGHVDTVTVKGYVGGGEVGEDDKGGEEGGEEEALGGKLEVRDGKKVVTGRGALDMKSGIAAGMALLLHAKKLREEGRGLKGDVILAAVADEEHLSMGTEELLRNGWRADAAVVTEPTGLGLGTAHKGFVWIEVKTLGRAAHGSMPGLGVDAIEMMGRVLGRVAEWRKRLPVDEILGRASAHCGTIKGGEENSSYPAECTVVVEVRTVPGQGTETVVGEIRGLLEGLAKDDEEFRYEAPKVLFERRPYRIENGHELVKMTQEIARGVLKAEVRPQGVFGWCDASLLGEAGIPSIVLGPNGEGLHGKDEWVEVESIEQTAEILKELAERWCS